jgi:hypothetical protein
MEEFPNGRLLMGSRIQLEKLKAHSRRFQQQIRDRTTATAAISSKFYLQVSFKKGLRKLLR